MSNTYVNEDFQSRELIIRENNNRWDNMKIKSFCSLENNLKSMKSYIGPEQTLVLLLIGFTGYFLFVYRELDKL